MNIDGNFLDVVIEKKKIKNIYFRINDKNQIYVTCPKYVSEKEINRLLEKNKDALIKMYQKQQKREKTQEKVLYLGNEIDYINFNDLLIKIFNN